MKGFVSTTIPYVNARPHLGHALEYVQADALTRHLRSRGESVFLLTGTDENSLKNVLAAELSGVPTDEFVAHNAQAFEDLAQRLLVSNDAFIRTSVAPEHAEGARVLWERLRASGDLYQKAYEGLYCVACEQFYDPNELVTGLCPEHAIPPESVAESNYFFRLSKYADELEALLTSGQIVIHPQTRSNEILTFIRAGLQDISVSRTSERARGWGIPVPGDDSQTMYVWLDALTNYINALGWFDDTPRYRNFWAEAVARRHIMGKGVTRFHAVYWPALLLSAGLPVPTDIVVHGYLTKDGRKISKSSGDAASPVDVAEAANWTALRYALLAEMSATEDTDFTEERMRSRYNIDLANGVGNLANRIISMINAYCGGTISLGASPLTEIEVQVIANLGTQQNRYEGAFARYDYKLAAEALASSVRLLNGYLNERAPWKLGKRLRDGDSTVQGQIDATLGFVTRELLTIASLLEPFTPREAQTLKESLGAPADQELTMIELTVTAVPPNLYPRLD